MRMTADGKTSTMRVLLTERNTRVPIPKPCDTVLLNEGGHGFYRVRYAPDLLGRLLAAGLDRLPAIERFNLLSDAWATTIAGLTPLTDYLDLTARFRQDRDKNVWAVLLDSFSFLNRIISEPDRPTLEAFVRDRVGPLAVELDWVPKSGESELTRQLRGELLGALGKLGNDREAQAKAAELYRAYLKDPAAVDANVLPALVAILAHTGDAVRYDEFSERFKTAKTPQDERRYLFSLAAFPQTELLGRTLARTLNHEIRTQDAPFIVSAVMGNVRGRELAWNFVKTNWDHMDRLFPKQGLRRMCGGIVSLATPELERDTRDFFSTRKIDLGGKTLEQYLEQLHIAVTFRERNKAALTRSLAGRRTIP
jgi:puromycin-sensitive aminopeptidase